MIRSILIISSAGIVIFSKSFVDSGSTGTTGSSMLGSLLRTISELGHNNHIVPYYMEYEDIVVMLTEYRVNQRIFCALIMDRLHFPLANHKIDPGPVSNRITTDYLLNLQNYYLHQELQPLIGSIISRIILNSFIEEHGMDLDTGGSSVGIRMNQYDSFNFRITGIIRDCLRYVLRKLVQRNGYVEYEFIPVLPLPGKDIPFIHHVMLIFADNTYQSATDVLRSNILPINIDDVTTLSSIPSILNAAMELGR